MLSHVIRGAMCCKVVVLTERTVHLDAIQVVLNDLQPPSFVLHGRTSRKQRIALVADLDALPLNVVLPFDPRVLRWFVAFGDCFEISGLATMWRFVMS